MPPTWDKSLGKLLSGYSKIGTFLPQFTDKTIIGIPSESHIPATSHYQTLLPEDTEEAIYLS